MTKDEIKKALEICTDIYAPCNGCPYEKCTNCDNTLHTDALNVIIEQEKEIERLRTTLGQCNTELNSALESLKSQCREIGELKAGVKQAKIDVLNKVKDIVFDYLGVKNIKEAEALSLLDSTLTYDVVTCGIDELIKEVENE